MKKILMSIMCLMISVMCVNATVTNYDTSLTVFSTMPRFGDNVNNAPLITSNQVTNIVVQTVDAPLTNISIQLAYSASMTNDNITTIRANSIEIVRGRLYISSTNGLTAPTGVFSQTAELTFADTGLKHSGRAIAQYDMGLVCVLFTNNMAAGSTNLYIQDTSGFDANTLLFLMGSNEFVRIQSIPSSTNVVLKFPTTYGHSATNGVSRVREFGSVAYSDSTLSNKLYTTTILPYNTNVTINLDIDYR